MPDPGAKSGAVSAITRTVGLANYVIFKPIGGQLRFDQAFVDGATIEYMVEDTAQISIEIGTFIAPDTLTRTTFKASNTGAPISWPETGQRTITPLSKLPICDTPPTDGQVLIWDEAEQNWCPGDISTPPTPPTPPTDCGVDMQNVDSGTSYSVTITKCETQVIWNSADPGEKDTTITSVGAGQDGYQLNIKANTNDGSVHCVTPTGATIGGLPSLTFDDNLCDLSLVYNHVKTDWLIRCLCCYTPVACEEVLLEVGAVSFPGTAFLWNFPAMSDSPEGSISFWIKTENSQLPFSGLYDGDFPDGDVFDRNLGYIVGGPPDTNFNSFFIALGGTFHHYGVNPGSRLVNPVTNVSSAASAVMTFTHPHGIPAGAYFLTANFNQPGWSGFNLRYGMAVSVTSNTITTDMSTAGFPVFDPGVGANGTGLLQVVNSTNWEFENFPFTAAFNSKTTKPIDPGVWVNVLGSWKTDLTAGNKILNLYYGDTVIPPDGSAPVGSVGTEGDINGSFSVTLSTPSASEEDSWMLGGTLTPHETSTDTLNCIICEMAEFWFAPDQYIDFSVAANRNKFHSVAGKPVSLGTDGSAPTGSPPVLYLSAPADPVDPYVFLDLPLRFVNPKFNDTRTGADLAGITTTMNVDLWDTTFTKHFNFDFPAPSTGDVFNICFSVDTNHGIGAKIVNAYVDNVPAAITVNTDNAANWLMDWTGGGRFAACNEFIADLWIAPGQFFDPANKFMDGGGNWIDIGTDGAGANGTAPSVYLSCRGSDPASVFADNRGTGGLLTQSGDFVLVPDGAVFLKNLSGNRDLLLNSGFTTFPLAASSPSD